ncbi:hypothetical protein MMC17_003480 [Xylographa soralifera]|nr:hypothetical protein [Xylographa soralifera]
MSSKLSSSLPPAGSSSSSGLMAHSSSRPSIADRVGARNARARPWLQSSSPAPIERPACVPAFRGTRKTGPYLSDRTLNRQSDTTVRQSPMSSRPRATASRVTPPTPILAVSQPRVSRRLFIKPQPDIAGPRTSVLSPKSRPHLSDRTTAKQSDTTVRQPQMSSRPRATARRVTPPAPILAVSQPRLSRRPLTKPQPDIAGPRTSVISRAPAAVNTQPEHFDPFLDLAIRESKTTRKAPPTYESVMARLAERKAAKPQTAAAPKPSSPSPSRQPPSRRAPSTTSTVSSRSTQRVSSNTSTVSSTSTQRNREMSPVRWQPLLPKIKAATPLPAPQPVTPPPAPQTLKVVERWSGKIWDAPLPLINGRPAPKAKGPCVWKHAQPDNQRLPGKSCLKSGSQLTKAKKSVNFIAPIGRVVVIARWINEEDCHENFDKIHGKLRRFNNASHVNGNQNGITTHEDCGCTMNVLQLTPEKHLPFYADTILADCRQLNLNTASSARMCSTFDGTGFTD